ncbi:MAG TPA: hypothetical protein DDW52_01365 [Planctomycetaceae bacterium]|nr:hypothetical protein [Planctomycetaceae bacterium]
MTKHHFPLIRSLGLSRISSGIRCLLLCLLICQNLPGQELTPSHETRTWRDKTGTYSVKAVFAGISESGVELMKSNGERIVVPINMLSPQDQKFLQDLQSKATNPFEKGAMPSSAAKPTDAPNKTSDLHGKGLEILSPDHEAAVLSAEGREIFTKSDEDLPPLAPGGEEIRAPWSAFVKGMPKYDPYTKRSAPVILSKDELNFAFSAHRESNAVADEEFGRIYMFRQGKHHEELLLDLPHTLKIVDHHIASDTTLVVVGLDNNSQRGGDLALLRGLASGKPDALVRWRVPGWDRAGFKPKVEFAKLISDRVAIVRVNDTVYKWDLASGECAYQVTKLNASGKIKLSPNGRYLALPESRMCRLVDLEEGIVLGRIPFEKLTPEVGFSPDGKRIALVGGSQVVIWNLVSGELEKEITVGAHIGKFHGWPSNNHILVDHAGLIDLDLGMAIWSYYLPTEIPLLVLDGGVIQMDLHSNSAIYSLPVPHDQALRALKVLDGRSASQLLALKPGSDVRIEVSSDEDIDFAAMEAGLKKAAQSAGWRVSPNAQVVLTARIGRGEKQTLHFRSLLSSYFDPGEKVKIRPFTAEVQIRQGNNLLWSRSETNMVPSLIHLKNGEKLKQVVKRYEKADPEYFERLWIPSKILSPDAKQKIGRSRNANGSWKDF